MNPTTRYQVTICHPEGTEPLSFPFTPLSVWLIAQAWEGTGTTVSVQERWSVLDA